MKEQRRQVCGHHLPALEADVLELLLAADEPLTVAAIQERLPGKRRQHTTVATLLSRLQARGLVERRRRGREYEWYPVGSERELALRALEKVLASVPDPEAVVLAFLEGRRRTGEPSRRSRSRDRGADREGAGEADSETDLEAQR